MGWSSEKKEILRALWASGLSASQIAAHFGDVTRNSVISKVHRSGFPPRQISTRAIANRPKGSIVRPTRVQPPSKTKPVKVALQPPSLPILKSLVDEMKRAVAIEEPLKGGIGIMDLETHHCRFIISQDNETARFCGEKKLPTSSYCRPHHEVCHSGTYRPGVRPPRPERAMHEEEEQAA